MFAGSTCDARMSRDWLWMSAHNPSCPCVSSQVCFMYFNIGFIVISFHCKLLIFVFELVIML